MDAVVPSSQAYDQSLVPTAIANALIRYGWQPPKASFSYHQPFIGYQLNALSSSTLTILQEDLATLHRSPSHKGQARTDARCSQVIDHGGQSTASGTGIIKFERGLIIHDNQHGYAHVLNVIDLKNWPRRCPSQSHGSSATTSHTSARKIQTRSSSDSAFTSSVSTPDPVVVATKTAKVAKARQLAQVGSQDTSGRSRKRRYSSFTGRTAVLASHEPCRTLAQAPPLSTIRATPPSTLPSSRVVAADFFTPQRSLEPGVVKAESLDFNVSDVAELIEEEKSGKARKHEDLADRTDLWSIDEHQAISVHKAPATHADGVRPAAYQMVMDADGRVFKKAKNAAEFLDRAQQHQTSGNTKGSTEPYKIPQKRGGEQSPPAEGVRTIQPSMTSYG
ncbi:MAG: hypothetical protein Q9218_008062 [Villophora microphyllina]